MKGYKVFNPDWTCRGFQYRVGETYEIDCEPVCCVRGFHFCENICDCFSYYDFNPENKVAEIEAVGSIDTNGNKSCTNKIVIVREIEWNEVLTIANVGKNNSGFGNSGNYNSGDFNYGNHSSGCFNTTKRNIDMFNRPTDWSFADWRSSRPYEIMIAMPTNVDVRQGWWKNLENDQKQEVMSLPNFDAYIFKKVTGIDVRL